MIFVPQVGRTLEFNSLGEVTRKAVEAAGSLSHWHGVTNVRRDRSARSPAGWSGHPAPADLCARQPVLSSANGGQSDGQGGAIPRPRAGPRGGPARSRPRAMLSPTDGKVPRQIRPHRPPPACPGGPPPGERSASPGLRLPPTSDLALPAVTHPGRCPGRASRPAPLVTPRSGVPGGVSVPAPVGRHGNVW